MKTRVFSSGGMLKAYCDDFSHKRVFILNSSIMITNNLEETTEYMLALVRNLDMDSRFIGKDKDIIYNQRTDND